MTDAQLAQHVAENRFIRFLALKHGLDPDVVLPEDLLLLTQNKDGEYLVQKEREWAAGWVQAEVTRAEAKRRRDSGSK